MNSWQPHPDSVTGPAQVVYIDRNDRIVTVKLLAGEDHTSIPGTILASRPLTVKTKPEQILLSRYWNWRTGKFWPANARLAPNPGIPNYFRIDLVGDPENPKFKYTIHSDRIV